MAKKSDFTEDEWKLLISTPRYILLAMWSADRTGSIAARSEDVALKNYLKEYKTRSPLVSSILEDQKDVSRRLRTKKPLEYIARTGKLLNKKANDSSGDAARKLLIGSASAIAEAVKESFRRKADKVTKGEAEMIAQIEEALKKSAPKKAVRQPVKKASAKPRTTSRKPTKTTERKPAKTTERKPTKNIKGKQAISAPNRPSRGGTSRGGTSTRPKSSAPAKPEVKPAAPAPAPKPKTTVTRPKKSVRSSKVVKPAAPAPAPAPRKIVLPKAPEPETVAPVAPAPQPAPEAHPTRPFVPDGSILVTRWTNVYSAPRPDKALDIGLAPNSSVTVLGRDQWGGWILVEEGWVPRDALTIESADGLSVVDDSEPAEPTVVTETEVESAEPAVVETMEISRWTNLFSKPEIGTATEIALEPGTRVVLLGASGAWIQVRYDETEGWIPTDALS